MLFTWSRGLDVLIPRIFMGHDGLLRVRKSHPQDSNEPDEPSPRPHGLFFKIHYDITPLDLRVVYCLPAFRLRLFIHFSSFSFVVHPIRSYLITVIILNPGGGGFANFDDPTPLYIFRQPLGVSCHRTKCYFQQSVFL
jgi:hypothetical protein